MPHALDVNEEPGNEVNEEPDNEVSEEPGNEVNEEPGNEVNEEPGNEVSEESGNEVNEEPGNEVSEEPGNEVNEETGNEVSEEPGNKVDFFTQDTHCWVLMLRRLPLPGPNTRIITGTSAKQKQISLQPTYDKLGHERVSALPGFHAVVLGRCVHVHEDS